MAERKSKPRSAEVDLDPEAHKKGDGILLLGLVIGAVAIVIGMVIVSNFLSKDSISMTLWVSFGITAVVDAAIFTLGFLERRRVHKA